MWMLGVLRFFDGELLADVAQRLEHDRHGDVLLAPNDVGLRLYGLCHSLPSCDRSFAAAGGPHVPAAYICSGGLSSRHAASIGSMSAHAASTSSARVNRVGSPIMQSSSRRSYASGVSVKKAVMYWKSIVTLRILRPALGTLAPNRSEMPSSGWMRSVIALGSSSCVASRPNVMCGGSLNWMRISVTRFGIRLPARM